jgi:23S rRNA pseudouridine1911/1915/1917 synthase
VNILFEDNHLLVVVKEPNIPMQEDDSKDIDLLTMAKDYLRAKYDKPGNIYIGMVHRLDRPVGGVVVLAKTSKAAARLSESIRTRSIEKEYRAIVEGDLPFEGTLKDNLKKESRTNMTQVVSEYDPEGKTAQLNYRVLAHNEGLSLIEINLLTGRSHQIRVQFASRKNPIWGDARYNPAAKPGQQIALWATRLTFPHPTTKEILTFVSAVPKTNPWNRFTK